MTTEGIKELECSHCHKVFKTRLEVLNHTIKKHQLQRGLPK